MNDDDLADLHLRIIAGDPDAFSAFEAAIRPRVYGLLLSKRFNEADVDEAWNDAFLTGIERAASIEPLGIGLRRFVVSVAYRRAVDLVRRSAARPDTPLDDADEGRAPLTPVSDPEKEVRVQGCVDAARPAYAAVMEMTARGMAASEMAAVLGKTEANAAKLRSRARVWFARCLEGVLDG